MTTNNLIIGCKGIQGKKRMAHTPNVIGIDEGDLWPENSDYGAGIVCVPDHAKFNICRSLLESGKHVMVEKPVLFTDKQFDEIDELCKEKELAFYTAYNHRFEPHIQRLSFGLYENINDYHLIHMFYGNGTAAKVKNTWRDYGAGCGREIGVHLLDMLHSWFGEFDAEWRVYKEIRKETNSPDYLMFGTEQITLETSWFAWKNAFRADFFTEQESRHLMDFRKWGRAIYIERERTNDVPKEIRLEWSEPDDTWEKEYYAFRDICCIKKSNTLKRDRWIAKIMRQIDAQLGAE